MIFLTVGTHEPFDRLVRAVDDWYESRDGKPDLFAQITKRKDGGYVPKNFEWVERLTPIEFSARFDAANVIVAHAGMGTIISALNAGKPIIVMPRRGHLNETRNDHQFSTVQQLKGREGIFVAMDETEIGTVIEQALAAADRHSAPPVGEFAPDGFTTALREFITSGKTPNR